MLGDDPPYLSVGTEVSAKYKGAFCEAKIRKVVRSVKCRVTYKQGLGTSTVTDDQIKGTLRVGASVEAKHNDRKEYVEATITKIQDCSQYTVVFDDGDITTLRRTALCLKSGRHFAESETLDQLPLTHPEHFGNPVIGGRRGRRSRATQDDSSDEDEDMPRGSNDSGSTSGGKEGTEIETEIGKVVCVELGDKKKKDNWFPGLVVAPTAQDTVRIRVRDEYLVRSFKDARYYTVPRKEATEFTKDLGNKVENNALKLAVEKALLFLEKSELPPHWDRDSLFGTAVSSGNSDSDEDLFSDSSDDEPTEEKDHFVAQLYKFMDDRGTPINSCPMIGNEDLDLYRLFRGVYRLGGHNRVTNQNQWKLLTRRLGFSTQNNASMNNLVKQAYKKYLQSFEDFYRKLGCTMVAHPRGSMRKQRPGRSLIRDKDRNTPIPTQDKPLIKTEKEDGDKDKRSNVVAEEEVKKEKREIKKEIVVKQEAEAVVPPSKAKRKEEPIDESASGQESDVNIDAEEESSCSEKSQKSSSRLTPSSGISTKSKASTKAKEEPPRKKQPAAEKKKPDTKRPDKKEDKNGGKDEESTKTRSRSKDDVGKQQPPAPSQQQPPSQPQQQPQQQQQQQPQQQAGKSSSSPSSDSRDAKTPSRDADKKAAVSKMRRMTEEEMKKRGRKKKEESNATATTSAGATNAAMDRGVRAVQAEDRPVGDVAPTYRGPIELGDRLKVYYGQGPADESRMTYEAKVIDIERDGAEAVYLVHYTGWNTRYDEWIKCTRIAQNFTQTQGRVKRSKAQARPPTPSSGARASSSGAKTATPSTSTSRRRAASVAPGASKDAEDRASTPVSRTKSPASTAASSRTSARQLARSQRRASGHAEPVNATPAGGNESEDSEDSESAAESDASIPEAQPRESRSRSRPQQQQPPPPPPPQERGRREARRRAESRMKIEETSDHEEPDKDSEETDAQPLNRRARRPRKPPSEAKSAAAKNNDEAMKSEPDTDTDEQPKGRDFDLNEIRSELKGFDKTVKLEIASSQQDAAAADHQPTPTIKQEKPEPESRETVDRKVVSGQLDTSPIKREQTIKPEPNQSDNTEDIYEFKEPEPCDFDFRNKRDSSGSEKDKEKDKDKMKKRALDEDLKSPKKRQKAANLPTTPVKVESKLEQAGQTAESGDSKKKSRKIFKKNEDADEEIESEDSSKFIPTTYSSSGGVVVYSAKRKPTINAIDNAFEDEPASENADAKVGRKTTDEAEARGTPKKRPTKNLLSGSPASTKSSESSSAENVDAKKRPRKVFGKKTDEADEDEDDSSKELDKFFSSYSGNRPARKADSIAEASRLTTDVKDAKLKREEDLTAKGAAKKRQKPAGVPGTEVADPKKKPPPKRTITKRPEPADTDESESDDAERAIPSNVKYMSHYSGPKAKAALASEVDATQDRSRIVDPKKSYSGATPSHETEEASRSKVAAEAEKKRVEQASSAAKLEPKPELMKTLDFTPVVPHSLPVPAPISTRLPATASIEEKLSLAAASVFRAKTTKDAKREDEPPSESVVRKVVKEAPKKSEPAPSVKKIKEKEETKAKHEVPEKRKPEQIVPKKDPLQEFEPHQDPLLEVINKREEEASKPAMPSVVKTYGNQKKIEHAAPKVEEPASWKKTKVAAAVAAAAASTSLNENARLTEANKDYANVRKEVAPNKIKPSIDRDSVDSSDSSDSERRLTIIDSEDAADDKCNDFGPELKTTKPIAETVATTICYGSSISSSSRGPTEKSINVNALAASVIHAKIARPDEDGENLNSLLCEEEIPGSPTPGTDATDHEHKASVEPKTPLKSEIGNKATAASFAGPQVSMSQQSASFAVVSGAGGSVAVSQSTSGIITMAVQSSNAPPMRPCSQAQLLAHQQPPPPPPQPVVAVAQMQAQMQPLAALQVVAGLAAQRRQSNEAAPVMDNTPPTTPDSTISNVTGSPRDERTGGSTPSSSEDNAGKTNRDSSEAENESAAAGKPPAAGASSARSEDERSPLLSPELPSDGGQSNAARGALAKRGGGATTDSEGISPKKRKRRKDQDASVASSSPGPTGKKSPRQAARQSRLNNGSDSDDTSESSSQYNNGLANLTMNAPGSLSMNPNVVAAMNSVSNSLSSFATNSNRPMRFNFLSDLDPTLDSNQRVQVLMQRITELRKVYNNCKGELASIERRRKKIKRRKREAQKAAKAEMQQACA